MDVSRVRVAMCVVALGLVASILVVRYSSASPIPTATATAEPVAFTPNLSHVPATFLATLDPGFVLSSIAARLGSPSRIRLAYIESPPPPHNPAGSWLHFVVDAPSNDERSIYAQWQTNLVAGAFADAIAGNERDPVVGGTTIDIELPDGAVLSNEGGGMGAIAHGQSFADRSAVGSGSALKGRLTALGLKLVELTLLDADQPAPAIIAQTDHPLDVAARAQSIVSALFLDGAGVPVYEGYYFEVRDSHNESVFIQAASFRSGAGNLWFRPEITDLISLRHG